METTAQSETSVPESHAIHRTGGGHSSAHRSHRHHHRSRFSRRTMLRVLTSHAKVIAVEVAIGVVFTYLIVMYLNWTNVPAIP